MTNTIKTEDMSPAALVDLFETMIGQRHELSGAALEGRNRGIEAIRHDLVARLLGIWPADSVQFTPTQSWDQDTRTKQLFERIAVLEREARELTTPPDVARMRAYETTLTQVLEWLDALVSETDDARLGTFCDRLAAQIRETMFGGSDGG